MYKLFDLLAFLVIGLLTAIQMLIGHCIIHRDLIGLLQNSVLVSGGMYLAHPIEISSKQRVNPKIQKLWRRIYDMIGEKCLLKVHETIGQQ